MHDVVFTNPRGIFGGSDDGSFDYAALTDFVIPKPDPQFIFQFSQSFVNSLSGNGSDPSSYGGDWRAVTPDLSEASQGV